MWDMALVVLLVCALAAFFAINTVLTKQVPRLVGRGKRSSSPAATRFEPGCDRPHAMTVLLAAACRRSVGRSSDSKCLLKIRPPYLIRFSQAGSPGLHSRQSGEAST